jgi:hypothetical protein
MDRPRRDSRQHNGITLRGVSQLTFATKSALNRPSDRLVECLLSGAKRKLPEDVAMLQFDPMYGPAVRCKRLWSTLVDAVLRQCIRSLIGACAPDHHGNQRACDLISGQASMGHLGHQCSHAPGRPILHRRLILSQSSAGKSTNYVIDSLLVLRRSFVRAWRPFLRPDLRLQRCAARRDRQGWPSRLPCLSLHRC